MKSMIVRTAGLALVAFASAALTASAGTLTWSGGATGSLTDANWSDGGTLRAPAAGDRLAIPAGTTITAGSGTATLLASLAGFDLTGTLLVDGLGAGCTLPAGFTLSGTGPFVVLNQSASSKALRVNGDNSAFSGPVVVSNSFFTVGHAKALGTGPVSIYKGALGQGDEFFVISVSGTYPNALYFDEGGGWFGFRSDATAVTWAGPVTCTASSASYCPRFKTDSATKSLTLTGGMTSLKGRVDFNNVRIAGENVTYQAAEDIFCDSGTLWVAAPIVGTKKLTASATIKFERADAFEGIKLQLGASGIVDLNGFSQSAGDLAGPASGTAYATSDSAPATLTVSGLVDSGAFGVPLRGHLSLAYAGTGAVTLTNFAGTASTTDGGLSVRSGTLRLGPTAVFSALSSVDISGGVFGVDAGAAVNSDVALVVSGSGVLDLASGVTLKVASASVGGTPLAAGTYTQAEPGALEGHLTGDGSLVVLGATPETVTLVWQGGDGDFFDANWMAEGETEPHVPVTGCRLSVPSGSTVTLSGTGGSQLTRFRGLDLEGAFVCSGFTEGVTLGEGFTLSGDGSFSVTSCAGNFRLAADNSAFTGPFSFLKTKVYVDHVRALGIANEVTASYGNVSSGSAYFHVNASGEFKNLLKIDGGGGYWAYDVLNGNKVVQSGLVRCMNTGTGTCPRFEAQNPATLTFTGGILGAEGASAGRADFNGNVYLKGDGVTYSLPTYFFCDAGTLHVGAVIDPATYLNAQATISFDGADLVSGVKLYMGGSGTATFDMNGFDQTTDEIGHATTCKAVLTSSAKPAVLTLDGSAADGTLGAALNGHLSFAFANASGSVTLQNAANNPSTTDGKVIARTGSVRIGSTANFTQLSALRVENGTLAIDAGAKIPATTRLEFVTGTGSLDLANGASVHLDTLTLDGAFLPKGTYSKSNPGLLEGRISGEGEIVIANSQGEITDPNVFHWVGGHGPSLLTAENWQEQSAPKLLGADLLVFAGGAPDAVVEGAIDVFGLRFEGNSDFTLGAGTGASINLGAGCFAVTNVTQAAKVTFAVEPVVVLQSVKQNWSVGEQATLKLPNTIAASEAVNDPNVRITVSGSGRLDLGGDNAAFLPTWIFADARLVPVVRHPAALGSPTRAIDVRSVPNAYVAMTNEVPIDIYDSYFDPSSRHLFNPDYKWYDQRGKVTFMTNGRTGYVSLRGGAISGGIEAGPNNLSGDIWIQAIDGRAVWITENPINVCGTVTLDNLGVTHLAVAGNHCKTLRCNKSKVVCEVDDVLDADGEMRFSTPTQGSTEMYPGYESIYGVFDLNGHSQTVTRLRSTWNFAEDTPTSAARAIIESEEPASVTLTANQTNEELRCEFRGQAGLTLAGTGRLMFTQWVSPTTGRLEVRNGEFVLDAGGGWGGTNGAEVVVSGGMLKIAAGAADTAFGGEGTKTILSVSDGGKIDIADGGTVVVRKFRVNGTYVGSGIYGGVNSPAEDKSQAAVFGDSTGVLQVLRPRGVLILVR